MYEGQGDTRARGRALQVGVWQFFFRREISLYIYMYIYIYIYVCVCVCVCVYRRLITLQYCGGFCHT